MTDDDAPTCHECGGVMRRDVRPDTIEYRGRTVTVDQPGWYCDACGEAVLTDEDARATERAFHDLKAEVEGVLRPAEVRGVRKRLGLSQRAASELLGGGPRAFQKYEAGTVIISRAMSNLLRLLANDPSRLRELRGDDDASAESSPAPPSRNRAQGRVAQDHQ